MKNCPVCGAQMADEMSFCTYCGASVSVSVPDETETAIPIADVPVVAEVVSPAKKNKKGLYLLGAVGAVTLVGIAVLVGALTNWFGTKSPIDKMLRAVNNTVNADSIIVEMRVEGEQTHSVRYLVDNDRAENSYILLVEDEESNKMLTKSGMSYHYSGVSSDLSVNENPVANEVFDVYKATVGDEKPDWKALVEGTNLDDYVEADKIDAFLTAFYKEYLCDGTWLKNTAGYRKSGNTYTFTPDMRALCADLKDLCRDDEVFSKEAQEMVKATLSSYAKRDITVTVTLDKQYVSSVEIIGRNGAEEIYVFFAIADVNHVDLTDEATAVEQYAEKMRCDTCGEVPYIDEDTSHGTCRDCGEHGSLWQDTNSCYSCYMYTSCFSCEKDIYRSDVIDYHACDYCYDCYHYTKCASCGGKVYRQSPEHTGDYVYNGREYCEDCYYYTSCASCGEQVYRGTPDSLGEYAENGKSYCYDCYTYVPCDDCGAIQYRWDMYSDGDGRYCYSCYYYTDCYECGESVWRDEYVMNGHSYCYSCYYRAYCYECGEEVIRGNYELNGHDYCWDCYYYTDCYACGTEVSRGDYEKDGHDYCWDCYYRTNCYACGTEVYRDDYVRDGHDYCYDCYFYTDCYQCGERTWRGEYELDGYDYCWDCYYHTNCYICGTEVSRGNYSMDGHDYCWDCYYEYC